MQVTHVDANISHAVISQNKAMDFGISSSAEFFNILSNTLYSDKILASAREVLCNAWDIHIQTKRTDRAVSVTLTGDKLVIRDFGTGISPDDIHPIYAIYGNSTKKLDGSQTGGFGLGSKAPFAYVEHFEVVSHYQGTKTVYAVSKSSAEVAGKPSIMPIVSVPTTETGLSVSFAIANVPDRNRFENIIRTIALFGEMNVELNGVKLPTVPFSEAKHGFLMTRALGTYGTKTSDRHFIRYGNVLYPIPTHEKLYGKLNAINIFLDRIGGSYHHHHNDGAMKIVFQAKPNTISVTPSRESLSMTDRTVESILELLSDFQALTKSLDFTETCIQLQKEAIGEIWKKGRAVDLITSDNQSPNWVDKVNGSTIKAITEPKIITNINGMSRAYISRSYPDSMKGFRQADILTRLDYFQKTEFNTKYMRGKIQSLRRFWEKKHTVKHIAKNKKELKPSVWFQKTIVQPLVRVLDEDPQMDSRKLQIYGLHDEPTKYDDRGYRIGKYSNHTNQLVDATKLSSRHDILDYLPFMRNIIVLSHNRTDIMERLPYFPIMKEKYGKHDDVFIYIVSRNDKKLDHIRKFFTDQGMNLIDLTKPGPHETIEVTLPVKKAKPATPAKPRRKGVAQLSAILAPDNIVSHSLLITNEQHARIEKPQFIVQINPRAQSWSIMEHLSRSAQTAIIRLYGEFGGIVTNSNQHERFVNELKISRIRPWVLEKLKEEVTTNPKLQIFFEMMASKHEGPLALKRNVYAGHWLRLFRDTPELCLEFDIASQVTQKEKLLWEILSEVLWSSYYEYYFKREDTVVAMKKHIEDIKPSKQVEELVDSIASSRLLGLLDVGNYADIFGENPSDLQKKQKAGALDILLYAMT